MSEDNEVFTGEYDRYDVIKDFKIPFKSNDNRPSDNFNQQCGNVEQSPQTDFTSDSFDSYVSPLAAIYNTPQNQVTFDSNNKTHQRRKNDTNSPPKPAKRKSLFMMPSTEGLPEELIKMFLPLCCNLCTAKLNSPSSARLHYESKNHEKKINHWLQEWSARTNEPIPKRPNLRQGPTGPNALHCDICDLALTSLQHAKQHNMGKRHRNALAGKSNPKGTGYYDANNQWVRTSKVQEIDPTNRFNIGESFLKRPEPLETSPARLPEAIKTDDILESPEIQSALLVAPPPPPPPIEQTVNKCVTPPLRPPGIDEIADTVESQQNDPWNPNYEEPTIEPPPPPQVIAPPPVVQINDLGKYCSICDVTVTSEMHMRAHLNGAKHAKKLRQLGEPPYSETPDPLSQCLAPERFTNTKPPRNLLSEEGGVSNVDYSAYRTPSGQYYCQVCDITVTSECMMSQHFGSKRHVKTAAAAKRK